jgi:predicted DNA-binding protein (UPF0278 family)
MSKKEFSYLLEKLENSKTEDEVYSNLKMLLKESSSKLYKHKILENPYFRSLIPDVREEVISDINLIRDALKEEIKSIDEEIVKLLSRDETNRHIDKFKELKRECISLVYEIDERRKDLNNLL